MPSSVVLLITSFVVGTLIGLTGMGGAALMTPFLILVVHIRPTMAVGTDLVYGAITKWMGAWVHWDQGTVDPKLALRLAYGSVPGGLIGVLCLAIVKQRHIAYADEYVRRGLGILLASVAIIMLARTFMSGQFAGKGALKSELWRRNATVLWGALVGLAVGFTSVGSGSLLLPFLVFVYPLPAARLVGTDVFHGAILVTATAAVHWGIGNVEWPLVPWLLAGSLPGVWLGSRLASRLPQRVVRVALSLVLLATGAKLI